MAKETLSSAELNRRAKENALRIKRRKKATHAAARGNSKAQADRVRLFFDPNTPKGAPRHKSKKRRC